MKRGKKTMKTCLLTGFEAFLDHPINPTEEVVKELNEMNLGEFRVVGRILPVVFGEAGKQIVQWIEEHKPDAIISLGLAAGRTKITPERVAINCDDGAVDNSGVRLQDALIEQDGDVAYFSTLPIRKMVNTLQKHNLPAEISNSAGTYVCNHVMYKTLHYLNEQNKLHIPAGFIHIPANHELAIYQPRFAGWSTEDIVKGVRLCIETL
jgi:pyroglutamyl-peptidase